MFEHLDDAQATEAISEMEDEYQSDFIESLDNKQAANVLGNMDPDDAAHIVRDLSYERAETLLRLMGVEDATEIRPPARLQGRHRWRHDDHAVRIRRRYWTIVGHAIEVLREFEDHPSVHFVYVLITMPGWRSLAAHLVLTDDKTPMSKCMYDDLITATPDETEEDVSADIFKYDLTAMFVVDEHGTLLGIVTVDDARCHRGRRQQRQTKTSV